MSQQTETVAPIMTSEANAVRPAAKPTARQWLLHIGLFILTAFSTTVCGIFMTAGDLNLNAPRPPVVRGIGGAILAIPWLYVSTVVEIVRQALLHPQYLGQGLLYTGSLLAILAAHESGHYLCCRYYGVEATLPFFIPQPPMLIPGTFGAFIRMKSAVPSRRALFDIGLAGPLAGFVVILPIAFVGVLTMQHETIPDGASVITFSDPLLFRLMARALRTNLADGVINPYYLAAWFGALVTALNLVPVGQLDGGHGTFAVFGGRAHLWIGRAMVVGMVALSVMGWLWYGSPAWFVFIFLLLIMLRVRHPQPERMEPLGVTRIIVGIITLIVFVLCFLPFPVTIT
jgi:membrane-associated protease RseP (regulator of RpoE activity)